MTHLLTCADLSKAYGAQPLFTGISLTIHEGERIGLIGPNGAGKSTFLKLLAAVEEPDGGTLTRRRQLRVSYVPQSESFPAESTVEDVLSTAYQGPEEERTRRIGSVRSTVGLPADNPRAESLSGGWRKRLAIAAQLLGGPELLLLDEPTNHLDIAGIQWLERFVDSADFAVVVISHDRVFLERTSSRIIEINRRYPQGFISVDGPYSTFLEKREEMILQLEREEQGLANRVRREIEWLRRAPKARGTKASARVQQAERMTADLAATRDRSRATGSAGVDFSGTGRQTKELLLLDGVSKRFGDRAVVRDLSLQIVRGAKLGIVGANGSGKSTVLRLVSGELAPDGGVIRRAPKLRTVTFDQERRSLRDAVSLRRFLAPDSDAVVLNETALHVAAYAKRFLFRPNQLDTPVTSLSGGEQARLLIARLMLEPADLLLLDEPTNDLDIDTLEVLEESLIEFTGALVIITHDRMMNESVCSRFLSAETGELYATVEQAFSASAAEASDTKRAEGGRPAAANAPKPRPKNESQKQRREIAAVEREIERAEAEMRKLEEEMSRASPGPELTEACARFAAAKSALDELYERWETLAPV